MSECIFAGIVADKEPAIVIPLGEVCSDFLPLDFEDLLVEQWFDIKRGLGLGTDLTPLNVAICSGPVDGISGSLWHLEMPWWPV